MYEELPLASCHYGRIVETCLHRRRFTDNAAFRTVQAPDYSDQLRLLVFELWDEFKRLRLGT